MGSKSSKPQCHSKIDFSTGKTPVVGIPLHPILHISDIHGLLFRWERLENRPVVLSQCADYTPTPQDIGKKLRFMVMHVDGKSGVCEVIVMDPVVEMVQGESVEWKMTPGFDNFVDGMLKIDPRFMIASYGLMGHEFEKNLVRDGLNGHQRFIHLEKKYSQCPAYVFRFPYRSRVLLHELFSYKADIYCLQSVCHYEYEIWHSELSRIGYTSSFVSKEGDNYGISIVFLRNKFRRIHEKNIWFDRIFDIRANFISAKAMENIKKCLHKNNVPLEKSLFCGWVGTIGFFELKDLYLLRSAQDDDSDDKLIAGSFCLGIKEVMKPTEPDSGKSPLLFQILQLYIILESIIMVQEKYHKNEVSIVLGIDLQKYHPAIHEYMTCTIVPEVIDGFDISDISRPSKNSFRCSHQQLYNEQPSIHRVNSNSQMKSTQAIYYSSSALNLVGVNVPRVDEFYPSPKYCSDQACLLSQFEFESLHPMREKKELTTVTSMQKNAPDIEITVDELSDLGEVCASSNDDESIDTSIEIHVGGNN